MSRLERGQHGVFGDPAQHVSLGDRHQSPQRAAKDGNRERQLLLGDAAPEDGESAQHHPALAGVGNDVSGQVGHPHAARL